MASKLQSLLGVAPLENLRQKKPQNQYGLSGQSMFGMDTPINTDFQQIGNQPLAPIRTQAPVQQNYFNTQMNNMGLQDPYSMSFGPDAEGGDEGTADPSGQVPEGGNAGVPGAAMDRFRTSEKDLIRTALQALPPSQAAQYEKFLADGELDVQEIGALAGFDYNEIEPGSDGSELYMALENAGARRFSDALANLGSELSNAQEYRSSLFGQTLEGASREAGTLLGMADAGSTSGLFSGRRAGQQQEATDVLENALSRQLLADESTYLSEVDSTGANVEDYPGYLQSTINSLGLSQNEMAQVNSYIRGYFEQYGEYPTSSVFDTWYQSTFGDEQQQGEE